MKCGRDLVVPICSQKTWVNVFCWFPFSVLSHDVRLLFTVQPHALRSWAYTLLLPVWGTAGSFPYGVNNVILWLMFFHFTRYSAHIVISDPCEKACSIVKIWISQQVTDFSAPPPTSFYTACTLELEPVFFTQSPEIFLLVINLHYHLLTMTFVCDFGKRKHGSDKDVKGSHFMGRWKWGLRIPFCCCSGFIIV